MRLQIELTTLGISGKGHGKIAECGGQLGVFLGWLLVVTVHILSNTSTQRYTAQLQWLAEIGKMKIDIH